MGNGFDVVWKSLVICAPHSSYFIYCIAFVNLKTPIDRNETNFYM
jgi:hypothetical protein